jgi:hypothetical protein
MTGMVWAQVNRVAGAGKFKLDGDIRGERIKEHNA